MKGYPDGSIGVVVKLGENIYPGQPGFVSKTYFPIDNEAVLSSLFTVEGELDTEVVDAGSVNSYLATIYNVVKLLKIKKNVTLYPKFYKPSSYLVVYGFVDSGGKIQISNGENSIHTLLSASSISGGIPPIVGIKMDEFTKLQITAPAYVFAVGMYSLDGEAIIEASGDYAGANPSTVSRSILLPGGVYQVSVTAYGNFDYGKSMSISLNGKEVASATYNPGSGAFFNDYKFPVKVDSQAILGISSSTSIRLWHYILRLSRVEEPGYINPKSVNYSASETSSTATKHSLMSSIKPRRYKNITVEVNLTSGGSAKLYMNGNVVATYTSSGTYTLPDFENIVSIEAELGGDGTNASSLTFNAIEEEKPIIVASLL